MNTVAQIVKSLPAMLETWVRSLAWDDPWRRNWLPLQHSLSENSMDRGAWQTVVHGVTKSQTRVRD